MRLEYGYDKARFLFKPIDCKEKYSYATNRWIIRHSERIMFCYGEFNKSIKYGELFIFESKMKIDNETIANFFEGIQNAILFDQVKRYNIRRKDYLSTPSKFYCQDIGLRNVRINFREPNQGFLIENAVYNELVTRWYRVDIGMLEQKKKNKEGKYVYV